MFMDRFQFQIQDFNFISGFSTRFCCGKGHLGDKIVQYMLESGFFVFRFIQLSYTPPKN